MTKTRALAEESTTLPPFPLPSGPSPFLPSSGQSFQKTGAGCRPSFVGLSRRLMECHSPDGERAFATWLNCHHHTTTIRCASLRYAVLCCAARGQGRELLRETRVFLRWGSTLGCTDWVQMRRATCEVWHAAPVLLAVQRWRSDPHDV
ncbi:uncharacterized protein K444DRAFT_74353 [Hyaloscypha bicolor E]|uniref:Uncharacterized protein n=1 Tax=Hyaloscypha bicolor E TaxID=1095630 RepID=A0A2J6SXW1_9HELO|nr:uncharacterized protein K444DRAFT_74353 [Hyaloscypha bicolor E]PMD55609.1 hypothetical protein K444DRAFT_74353 [Hyaloscypha bicolor E]